jgi:hypothetical protein
VHEGEDGLGPGGLDGASAEELPAPSQGPLTGAIGEEADVADAHEAARQDVQ